MKSARFAYFVVLAGMRTGSNLLEEHLSAMDGLTSYGEVFNPHFFGQPKAETLFGFSLTARDSDPVRVIEAMRGVGGGLPGFRLFHDHDQRVIDHVLADESAAKIILTRRPLESYVSLKIARKTDQWWLGDMASARTARVAFDAREYADFVNVLAEYQHRVRKALQASGQTAFHIDYSELSDPDVIDGLGRFLGVEAGPRSDRVRARVQNPQPIEERLTNAAEADRALRDLAAPDIGLIPSHEPERGPGLRMFQACQTLPLLYMPIRGGGADPVTDWLRSVDPDGSVLNFMSQKEVRQWMRQHPGHRSFTVLRHPLPRAYDAFCRFVLPTGAEGYADIRTALITRYNVALPKVWPDESWTADRQREAFLGFLTFLAGNLGGQTSLRVDYSWSSQAAFLSAIARFVVPDRVIREDTASAEMKELAHMVGYEDAPVFLGAFDGETGIDLSAIRTSEIDKACETAYRRDYIFFGFGGWAPPVQAA